jgi:hypothetical protein
MDATALGPIHKFFWKAGGLVALLILTFLIGNFLVPADMAFDRHMFGHDFLPFYTAGQFMRMGRVDQLYDAQATRAMEHETCQTAGLVIHNEYGAFLNPPFVALPAAWLARWPYPTALMVWTSILLGFLAGAMVLMWRMFPAGVPWRIQGLLPLLIFSALPFWQAAIHAQNTFFSLLVLSAAVTLWRNERAFAAGLVAGLLLFKPQLGAVFGVVLTVSQGRRALVGMSITGATLLLVTLIAMPGAIGDYGRLMPGNLQAIQELANYQWHRHITFLAWWRILLQGHVAALPGMLTRELACACMTAVGAGLALAAFKARHDRQRTDRLIAATIATAPLVMPYYMDYDMSLLAVAGLLCAIDAIRHGVDRRQAIAWTVLYMVMEVNTGISGSTRLIPAVPALAVLAVLLIRKAANPIAAAKVQSGDQSESPRRLAMAA